MQNSGKKLVSPIGIVTDLILTAAFFYYMVCVCRAHVPIENEPTHTILAVLTATPVTTTFWLGLQCFRVTLVDQLRRRKEKA